MDDIYTMAESEKKRINGWFWYQGLGLIIRWRTHEFVIVENHDPVRFEQVPSEHSVDQNVFCDMGSVAASKSLTVLPVLPYFRMVMTSLSLPGIVVIPAGWFLMGSEQGQENEKPCRRVWVDGFGIAKYPVTRSEYQQFLADTERPQPPFWGVPMFACPRKPVVGVDWYDAEAYCRWLSGRSGMAIRLPTEAEWERAARGTLEGAAYPWGDRPPWENAYAGCDEKTGGPAPVGVNEPNAFGLYDMSEGVHEWCGDYYDYNYYRYAPARNPRGPLFGQRRTSRGGSWRHKIKFSRCAARSSLPPSFKYSDYGFRVAMTVG